MKIAEIAMFQELSNRELAKLLGKMERQTLQPGDVLFAQGEFGDSMYIIDEGSVELFVQADGAKQSLAVLGEGDTLGEMALLTGEARSATAVAAAAVVLLKLDRDAFDALITEQPAISAYFIRLISRRLIDTNERLRDSKEQTSQWLQRELAQLPDKLVQLLLWLSQFSAATVPFAERRFGLALRKETEIHPALRKFLAVEPGEPDRCCLKPDVRAAVAELAGAAYDYKTRRQWIDEAEAFYAQHEQWLELGALYRDEGKWESVLHAFARSETQSEWQAGEWFVLLGQCPEHALLGSFPAMERYVRLSLAHGPEQGLRLVEAALREGTWSSLPDELIALYEWGAACSRSLRLHHRALEYLQLAESSANAAYGRAPARHDEERDFQLAQRQLSSHKSVLFAERASRMFKPSQWAEWLALAAAAGMIVLFALLPPFAGLTDKGMLFIGIAVAAVLLWIVNIVPDYIVALGMAMLWVLGGVVEPETALSGFASPTWLYMIFIMSLSVVIAKSGILYRLSLHALKRFPAHFRGQLWGLVAGGIALNPLIPSSSAKVSLGVPIARTLSESMGFKDRSKGAAGLGLAAMVFYGFTAPFVLTGSYTNVMAFSLANTAEPVTWLEWALYALPAFVVFAAVMLLVLSWLFQGSSESVKQVSASVLDEQLRLLGPLSREERISAGVVVGCIVMMMLQPLHGIDSTWVMLLGFAVLVITGVLDRQSLLGGIDWTFLLFLGVAFSFANAAGELGIVDAMTGYLGGHMSLFLGSPALFLTAVIALCFAVTLVVRDDAAVILLVTALLPLAAKAGIHPWILVFVVLLSTDPFFFSYQSPTYLTAYFSSDERAFSHRQGQQIALAYAAAVVLAVIASIPYWQWLGLLG